MSTELYQMYTTIQKETGIKIRRMIGSGNGKIRYLIPIPNGHAEHDTHKAVTIQIVGAVVCGMVKQF